MFFSCAALHVAPHRLVLQALPLVVQGLAAAYAEGDLYAAALQVDLERDERKPLRLGLQPELLDLVRMDFGSWLKRLPNL